MIDSSIVIGFMEASITGAGLVLAAYALIIPMFHRVFEELNTELNDKLAKFEEVKSNITPVSNNKEMKQLTKLRKDINYLKKMPVRLFFGVIITFVLYLGSVVIDALWLTVQNPDNTGGYYIVGIFMVASAAFFYVGIVSITTVYIPLQNEFKQITKKQEEHKSSNRFTFT